MGVPTGKQKPGGGIKNRCRDLVNPPAQPEFANFLPTPNLAHNLHSRTENTLSDQAN